jgi:gas vesicle protein
MKMNVWVGVLAVAAMALVGCTKSGVDTSKVESSFSEAEPAAKSAVDQVVTAVKAGDYAGALVPLQKLASNAKLTPEQQQAVKDLMTQVQEQVKAAAVKAGEQAKDALEKASDSTGKALEDLGGKLRK